MRPAVAAAVSAYAGARSEREAAYHVDEALNGEARTPELAVELARAAAEQMPEIDPKRLAAELLGLWNGSKSVTHTHTHTHTHVPTVGNTVLKNAIKSLSLDGLPREIEQHGANGRKLLALCRRLQELNESEGRADFILSSGQAAAVIGTDRVTAHRMLGAFIRAGWLKLTYKGQGKRGGHANQYAYIHHEAND